MVRRRTKSIALQLGELEVELLENLLDELEALALDPADDDPVTQRLYIDGYADPVAAADFRDLTRSSLQSERRDRYGQSRAELPFGGGELTIDAESVGRWLMVINDMRLALGTRLGVTAEGFAPAGASEIRSDGSPDAARTVESEQAIEAAQAAYHWLTALQDGLVNAVTP